MSNGKRKDSLIWGLILVVLGLLFLLDNLNFNIDVWHELANFWPVILILWGAWKLYLGLKDAGTEANPESPARAKK